MYSELTKFIRDYRPRVLAVLGKNEPYLILPGAEAWVLEVEMMGATKQNEEIQLDIGHFALEINWDGIGVDISGSFLRHAF